MTAGGNLPGGTQGPRRPKVALAWPRIAFLALAGLVLAADASAWCNIGASCNKSWGYRRKLLLNSAQGVDLANFPVLVVLNDPARIDYSKTQSLGQDIRFVDSDDSTLLNHEIERWTPGGTSYVWVQVPQVDGPSTTDFIWMYYGNPSALDGQNVPGTWDSEFMMVHHLNETCPTSPPACPGTPGAHTDSATADGASNDSVVIDVQVPQGGATGQIAGADTFSAASTDNIDVPNNASLNVSGAESFTVEAWVRTPPSGNPQHIAVKEALAGVGTGFDFLVWFGGEARFSVTNSALAPTSLITMGGTVDDNQWHYVVGRWTRSSSTTEVFVDGAPVGTPASNGVYSASPVASTQPFRIGERGDENGCATCFSFDGMIDEVRFSKAAEPRSNEWIAAQNRSMRDNSFVTYGPEAAQCCGLGVTELASDPGAGNAHTIKVNGPTRFDIRFNEAIGAGIDRFFDLEEEPTTDLAGGDPPGMQPALFTDEINGNITTGENTQGAELDLLEVTPARVKVRQEAFYQENAATNIVPGLKGYGNYSIYGIGRLALGWERQVTTAQSPTMQQLQWTVRYTDAVAPLDLWQGFSENLGPPMTSPFGGGGGVGTAGDNFVLAQSEQPNARTDFLAILHQDWANSDQTFFGSNTTQNWEEVSWIDDAPAAPIPVGSERVNFLTYFKPTTLANGGAVDALVTSRANDYRSPSPVTVGLGGTGWVDASEFTNTDPLNVFFNEAEAAYVFDFSPATGLSVAMDGSTTTRHYPFLKIRQWRSFSESPIVTFDPDGPGGASPSSLTRNTHYRAAVKPVARAHFAQDLTWHSTLQSSAAVDTFPQVGSPGTRVGADFPTGRFGNGAQFNATDEYLYFPAASNFSPTQGAIEFWYKPAYDYGTHSGIAPVAGLFGFWVDAQHYFYAFHEMWAGGAGTGEGIRFQIGSNAGNLYQAATGAGPAFPQYWRTNEWVHLRFVWKRSPAPRLEIYINGKLASQAPLGAYTVDVPPDDLGRFHIGDRELSGSFNEPAAGIIDEFYVYGQPDAPRAIAHGGLTTDAREFLADATDNFSLLDFDPVVGAEVRGEYLYFGADAKFRGLNVNLAQAGTGPVATAILWQYWDGTRWSALPGVTDQTNSFTKPAGTIYWVDPGSWNQYSVNGGPDLYYVRASLTGGVDYTTPPVERIIKTDILLFQYCNDVTAANQTFAFAVPPTTEVKLSSFAAAAGDRSVILEWWTASELSNLGFHVYRSPSADGPWTRLTTSLIPGLGSSAVGQGYSFRDAGLVNGTRYFYRLEDVDASSKTTSHGPVSAVPTAGASADDSAGRNQGAEKKKNTASSSCPDWVLSAYASAVGSDAATTSLRCTRHGDPEASSLETLSRDSRQATLELRTRGFYALHEASGTVRVFVPGFDFPQDEKAAALPIRRALADAVVGRRVQLGGVRALDLVSFKGLVPSSLGKAEMQVGWDGTVRPARRSTRVQARQFLRSELVSLLPSLFQGEQKSAVVEIAPLRFDAQRQQLVLAKRVRVRLLFTGRAVGESGRGSVGRAQGPKTPVVAGEILGRLYTTSRGLYSVSFEQLFPGQSRGFTASQLRLERQGEPVGFHLEPSADSFGPGSRLYFYADKASGSTEFSGEVAYELVRSAGGVAMPLQSAVPGSSALVSASRVSRAFETNRIYQPGLLDALDPWLWEPLVSGVTRVKSFTLTGVTGSGEAELEVYVQGASESGHAVDHHLSVSLNGVLVGDVQFAGKKPYRMSLSLPGSLLREGANDFSLTNVGDTGVTSLVFLDRFDINHPQASSLTSGLFEGTWAESGSAAVLGLTGPAVLVDVTAAPQWLTGYQASGGGVSFQAAAGHRYLVASQEALLAPRVAAREASTLRATTNQADYILVAPKAFLPAAEPLVRRRADQGLTTRAVAFEEIATEFGHGQPSAEAIKAFLAYAYQSWTRPSPRYVLLLGDASYDPRNFIGSSPAAPLPALWTKTSYLWTVSDPQLAAVNGEDALPDLAIGRLPAATVEQAEALVAKLLAWEDSGQGLSGAAALVADNPDIAGDFEADARDIAQSYLSGRNQLLLLSELGAETRPAILDALNSGLSYLNYVGHGGAAVWASENVWNSWDAPSLLAQSQQPLLVTMNCLNGYFVAPSFDSLSESLLKAEGRGAIASFSPSGLSLDGPAHQYHRALMAELTSGKHARLGDAILAAQKTYAGSGLMPELLGIYHLLGDPAMPTR